MKYLLYYIYYIYLFKSIKNNRNRNANKTNWINSQPKKYITRDWTYKKYYLKINIFILKNKVHLYKLKNIDELE